MEISKAKTKALKKKSSGYITEKIHTKNYEVSPSEHLRATFEDRFGKKAQARAWRDHKRQGGRSWVDFPSGSDR